MRWLDLMETQHLEFFRGKNIEEALAFIRTLEPETIQDILSEAEFFSLAYPRGTNDLEIESALSILCEAFETPELMSYQSASIRCGLAVRKHGRNKSYLRIVRMDHGSEKLVDAVSMFLFHER